MLVPFIETNLFQSKRLALGPQNIFCNRAQHDFALQQRFAHEQNAVIGRQPLVPIQDSAGAPASAATTQINPITTKPTRAAALPACVRRATQNASRACMA